MKNVTVSPPKSINTKILQEISSNTLHHRFNMSSSKKPLNRKLSISDSEPDQKEYSFHSSVSLEELPCELHRVILTYLPSDMLITKIQLLSRHFRDLLTDPSFWQMVNGGQPLSMSQQLRKVQLLAERRSKGKLFKAVNRISGKVC